MMELGIEFLMADKPTPQVANMAVVNWQALISGGVGELTFDFILSDGETEIVAQSGPSLTWQWIPKKAGVYRIKMAVSDSLGKTVLSDWSEPFEVLPELKFEALHPEKPAPQAANMAEVNWRASASGGVGTLTFDFILKEGDDETVVQSSTIPFWQWKPKAAGNYRVMAVVSDSKGNTKESGWSDPYEVTPELMLKSLIVDMPSPQRAVINPIQWKAIAEGGVSPLNYTFNNN